mgnify:CR=1 FL=1
MDNVPLHRLYRHFSELPYSLRVLYTATLLILGTAYLFAMIYLFHSYSGKDGNARNLTYEDIVIAYSGSGKGSRLDAAAAAYAKSRETGYVVAAPDPVLAEVVKGASVGRLRIED